MYKTLFLSTTLLLSFTACQKRACPQTESYNGLYNALTCDYQSEIFNLEENLSEYNSKTTALQTGRNKLENEIYSQETQLNYQKEQIKSKELILNEVQKEVTQIDDETKTKEILENLNLQIKNMRKAIKD